MTFNRFTIPEKIKVGYTMERVEQFFLNPLQCYKCQRYGYHEYNCKGKEVCRKCGQQNPDHHINDCDLLNKCANCGGDHPVYSRSCESWRQEKEILKVKHQNNIPFHEARKIVVGSKATTYAQAVQHNKSPHNYESMIKTLIQLEWGEWEGYINKIKSTFNIVRAPETPNTSGDIAENKEPPIQTQTPLEKADHDEKPIPSTS